MTRERDTRREREGGGKLALLRSMLPLSSCSLAFSLWVGELGFDISKHSSISPASLKRADIG